MTAGKAHLRNESIAGGVINALFNGIVAWLLLKGGPALTWAGADGFAVDILATGFLLPFIVTVIVIPIQRRKLARGKLNVIRLSAESRLQNIVDRMPKATVVNAFVFGLIGVGLIAPPTLLFLLIAGVDPFEPMNYAIFKGVWAGLLAATLVIPMILVALRGTELQGATV